MSSSPLAMPAPDTIVNFIERAARDPAFDVAKLEALLRMQREVVQEQAKREFSAAMALAQSEMLPVVRDAANDHTRSRYARLETIDQQMRPIYTKNGFSVRYGSGTQPRDGWIRITCTVAHQAGYSEEHHLDAPLDFAGAQGRANKPAIQAVGSSITYLRRYLLCMVFNVVLADEDDDGEATRISRPALAPRRAAPSQSAYDPTAPEYRVATNNGGKVFHTGTEFINFWTAYPGGLIARCQKADALDKLRAAWDMNRGTIEAVREFDPRAAEEVENAIRTALGEAAPEQAPTEAAPDQELADVVPF